MDQFTLSREALRGFVASAGIAFRLRVRLEPVSEKVFPPTYQNGTYATERRRIEGRPEPVDCVLLDSVPSQANRMELALQDAWEAGQIELPVVSADFAAVDHPNIRKVTSLQAPHRLADAILRDSLLDGKDFRKSPIGTKLNEVSPQNATPLLEHCPTALVFGLWDSTGPRGGLGVKFARALVSEIVGVNAVPGVKTSSRIDPLNIRVQAGVLFESKDGGWTLDEKDAAKESKGKPKKFKDDGRPSAANHGNVTPTRDENTGGFTIEYAEQSTVLSLPALRRLKFPLKPDQPSKPETDAVARTYLAALGLLGATLAVHSGYDLRSRCILRAVQPVRWELLGAPGEETQTFELSPDAAVKIYKTALGACIESGLPFQREEVILKPSADLVTLVKRSIELAAAEVGEGD